MTNSGPEAAAWIPAGVDAAGLQLAPLRELEAAIDVIAITSTNFSTRGMHEQTDRLLVDHILAAVETG